MYHHEGSATTPQTFTGQRFDASTGLFFYNARYYDSALGRFIQADPTVLRPGDPQDLNRYAYARNNPINNVDPSGHGWFKKFFGTMVSIAFTFIGMPFIGALVGSAINTIMNKGSFADFAIGLGIGMAAGYVGGSIVGGFARNVGMNLAGIETAVLRGALSANIYETLVLWSLE